MATWGVEEKTSNFDFKKQNQELILLGNGYTLDIDIDLQILKNIDVFGCNEFFWNPYFNEIVEKKLFFALDEALLINELFRIYKACSLGSPTKNIYL